MFGAITTPDIQNELRRRGIYTEVVTPAPIPTPVPTPTPTPTPFMPILTPEITPLEVTIPEAPATPVEVIPGPPPVYYEPVMPYVAPALPAVTPPAEVTPREMWLPSAPPTRAPEERRISKSAVIAGVGILAAIVIFTHKGAKKPARRPALRRRATTEAFRPARTEAMS